MHYPVFNSLVLSRTNKNNNMTWKWKSWGVTFWTKFSKFGQLFYGIFDAAVARDQLGDIQLFKKFTALEWLTMRTGARGSQIWTTASNFRSLAASSSIFWDSTKFHKISWIPKNINNIYNIPCFSYCSLHCKRHQFFKRHGCQILSVSILIFLLRRLDIDR